MQIGSAVINGPTTINGIATFRNPSTFLNPVSGDSSLFFSINNSARWQLTRFGANSDLAVNRYNDTGTFVDSPVTLERSSGIVTLQSNTLRLGGASGSSLVSSASAARTLTLPNATGTLLINTVDLLSLNTDGPILTPGGRLTLSSTNPLGSGTDTSALYYLPYTHDYVPVYLNVISRWGYRRIPSGLTINIPTTANCYDIVANAANATEAGIFAIPWANYTTRNFALSKVDGVYVVNNGAGNFIYLGTVATSGSTPRMNDYNAGTDSAREVWNFWNQVAKNASVFPSAASWSYSSNAWREMNGSAAISMVDGIGSQIGTFYRMGRSNSTNAEYGIAIDQTTGTNMLFLNSATSNSMVSGQHFQVIGLGRHIVYALERSNVNGTSVTFTGSSTQGIRVNWLC